MVSDTPVEYIPILKPKYFFFNDQWRLRSDVIGSFWFPLVLLILRCNLRGRKRFRVFILYYSKMRNEVFFCLCLSENIISRLKILNPMWFHIRNLAVIFILWRKKKNFYITLAHDLPLGNNLFLVLFPEKIIDRLNVKKTPLVHLYKRNILILLLIWSFNVIIIDNDINYICTLWCFDRWCYWSDVTGESSERVTVLDDFLNDSLHNRLDLSK